MGHPGKTRWGLVARTAGREWARASGSARAGADLFRCRAAVPGVAALLGGRRAAHGPVVFADVRHVTLLDDLEAVPCVELHVAERSGLQVAVQPRGVGAGEHRL